MKRLPFLILLPLLIPLDAFAAAPQSTFLAAQSLLATSSSPGNTYSAGASVIVTAPTQGDLTVVGGSIITASPVAGDEMLLGGSVSSRAPVKGDFRGVGGNINITEPVAGDVVALGFSVHDTGRAGGSVFIVGANVSVDNGAEGPVTIYGNNVFLSGDFESDVNVVAAGAITLAKDSTIRGTFSYEAPEKARIAASTTIVGGVKYTSASYLPDAGTSRALALASIGIFLLLRILGALILAGLVTGLFPGLASAIAERALASRIRRVCLTTLLGFAVLVATPILLALTALTFVGFGIAFVAFVAYLLLVLLSFVYAGVLLGTMCVRAILKRETVLWHDGVLGMLIFSLLTLIPIFGKIIAGVLTAFTAGALFLLFFRFAFPHEESTPEML